MNTKGNVLAWLSVFGSVGLVFLYCSLFGVVAVGAMMGGWWLLASLVGVYLVCLLFVTVSEDRD